MIGVIVLVLFCIVALIVAMTIFVHIDDILEHLYVYTLWGFEKPKVGRHYARNNNFYKLHGTNPFEDLRQMEFCKVIDIKDGWILFQNCTGEYDKNAESYCTINSTCTVRDFKSAYVIPSKHADKMINSRVKSIRSV